MKASIGCVPIVWNNVDLPELAPTTPYAVVLDELARLGYAGTQFGRGFPEGEPLAAELRARDLRLAEWYCALPAGPAGLLPGAELYAQGTLLRMLAAGGETLVVAVEGDEERDAASGRVTAATTRWPDRAFDYLANALGELAAVAGDRAGVAFHPHTGSWVESPDEVELLATRLFDSGAGLCLDVGHYTVGGGDAVAALDRYGELVTHLHLKDVDPEVLANLRSGEIDGFEGAVRERIFTELGRGILDLDAVLASLDRRAYDGWLMVEQDSSWLPPAEAAAIGRDAVRAALERVG